MKINKIKLIKDVEKVLPGISSGDVVLEGADTAVFKNNHIYSYNSAISVDVANSQQMDLQGVVKGKDFYNCLVKLPNDEIDISAEGEHWVIRSDKIKVKINLLPSAQIHERFDSLVPVDSAWSKIDGKKFQEVLKICSMPKNNSKFAGLCHKVGTFISTDSYIINACKTGDAFPDFWIAKDAVSELLKWDNFDAVQMNKMWLQFKSSDETVFSVRCLDLDLFPFDKVEGVLKSNLEADASLTSTFSKAFYESVNRASIFSGESDGHSTVTLKIGQDGTSVLSKRLSGEYEEFVNDITSEKPFELVLDVSMLQDSQSLFDKFRLTERGESVMVILERDNAWKMFSNII